MRLSRPESSGALIPALVFTITAIVYLPVINWLFSQTVTNEQLTHALLVSLLTGMLLATSKDVALRPVWKFSDKSLNLLILSYALLAVAVIARINILVLLALSLSLAAFLFFALGSTHKRFIFSSVGAFGIFTVLAALLPALDWPLRSIAGRWSGLGLELLGQETRLGIFDDGREPMLILLNNGQPFHVAAECNGFGMLSSCLLMTLIVVLYKNFSFGGKLVRLGAALLLATLFNSIRIILIVLIAPRIPADRYMLMHEAVGLMTTYGGLALLYFLLTRSKPGQTAARH